MNCNELAKEIVDATYRVLSRLGSTDFKNNFAPLRLAPSVSPPTLGLILDLRIEAQRFDMFLGCNVPIILANFYQDIKIPVHIDGDR